MGGVFDRLVEVPLYVVAVKRQDPVEITRGDREMKQIGKLAHLHFERLLNRNMEVSLLILQDQNLNGILNLKLSCLWLSSSWPL